jgi:hypothetical protein
MVEALRLSIHAKAAGPAMHGAQANLVARFANWSKCTIASPDD